MAANIHESGHPLIMHKITNRKAAARRSTSQLIKEVSTFLCYEATKDLPLEACDVQTLCGAERGQRIAQRVGVVPVLRGGLGMVEAMTEFAATRDWHLGIYRDKSLLPVSTTTSCRSGSRCRPSSSSTRCRCRARRGGGGDGHPQGVGLERSGRPAAHQIRLPRRVRRRSPTSRSRTRTSTSVGLIDRVQVAAVLTARAPPARRPRAARAAPAPHRPTDRAARRDARRTRGASRSSRCSGWATSATASSAPSPTTPCRPTEKWMR